MVAPTLWVLVLVLAIVTQAEGCVRGVVALKGKSMEDGPTGSTFAASDKGVVKETAVRIKKIGPTFFAGGGIGLYGVSCVFCSGGV